MVDHGSFAWGDSGWSGLPLEKYILYELHVGAFTPEGTWRAAAEKLAYLADTGITVLEVLPVSEFPLFFTAELQSPDFLP